MVAIKTLIFSVLVPGSVTIFIPYWILSARPVGENAIGSLRYLGIVPIAIGTLIYLRCAWDFTFAGRGTPAPIDPPKVLVTKGLYRYSRNPMYVGILSVLIGEVFVFQSGALLQFAVIMFVLFFAFVFAYEEPTLRRKFGALYEQYCREVPRWLWPKKFRAGGKR